MQGIELPLIESCSAGERLKPIKSLKTVQSPHNVARATGTGMERLPMSSHWVFFHELTHSPSAYAHFGALLAPGPVFQSKQPHTDSAHAQLPPSPSISLLSVLSLPILKLLPISSLYTLLPVDRLIDSRRDRAYNCIISCDGFVASLEAHLNRAFFAIQQACA